MERLQSLGIGHVFVLSPSGRLKVAMLRANSWVVQSCRDAVSLHHLAVFILEQVGHCPVQYSWPSCAEGCRVPTSLHAIPAGFQTNQAHIFVGHKWVEHADGVTAAADTSQDIVRQRTLDRQ